MKKRNNAFARLVGLLLVSATVLTLTVAATGGAGTSSDPLVTLSYLNEKFLPQILSEVDKKTASREQTLSSKLTEQVKSETQAFEQKYSASSGNASGGTAASFTVVTLNQGQILYMGVGCEAMLRTGSGNGALSLYGSANSFPLFSSRIIAPDNSESAPFPLPELFCLAHIGTVDGRKCVIYRVNEKNSPIL